MSLRTIAPTRMARGRWAAVALLATLALSGCKPTPQVTKYTAPHQSPEELQPDPPEGAKAGDRIVGVIIAANPSQTDWWFFKLRGQPDALGRRVKPFQDLVGTLRLPSNDGDLPQFNLPAGWKLGRGSDGIAAASIQTGHPFTPHAISVSRVGGDFTDNVNRWREQVGLERLPADKLRESLRELKTADGKTAYWVDVAGPGGSKAPPFMHMKQ